MFLIIGTRLFSWGSERDTQPSRCNSCGTVANFILKKAMRFITIFFIVPILPISGIKQLLQCPSCGARYQA